MRDYQGQSCSVLCVLHCDQFSSGYATVAPLWESEHAKTDNFGQSHSSLDASEGLNLVILLQLSL